MDDIMLLRYGSTPMGTFGEITLPDGTTLKTCEREWQGNKRGRSCIPQGIYTLRKRRSPVVERTSRGSHSEGWEVTGVPGRTYIMLHPGNTISDSDGCILPGKGLGFVSGHWAVTSSQHAFDVLMSALDAQDEWIIDIRWRIIEDMG